jgi:hypothetical protein
MSLITWVAILVSWPLVGLAVAYLFGRFTHREEIYGNPGQLSPPILSYLRSVKRAGSGLRAAAHAKPKREAAGGRRLH